MCDTIVALPNSTADGRMIFGKNSDRSPNEPHIVVKYPAKDYDINENPVVKLTYISIPQAAHTNEVVLMKPSWIWGAEMGFNEYGLNIGNEAVFTIEKKGKESLTGMDMLRLALERTAKASAAVEYMISLLAEYGQGGNCGYDHEFHYHNSFLIADREEAYVLETAGIYYAVKKVKDVYALSNCLSIENDYDMLHPDAIKNAIKKRRCKLTEDFNFAKCYSDKVYTYFSKAKIRKKCAMKILEKNKGNISVDTFKSILRSHDVRKKENCHSVASVCMHAGGLIGDHTTGSYIASLSEKDDRYYITGTSLPCISLYKPLIFSVNMPIVTENETVAKEYWMKNEKLNRYIIAGQVDRAVFLSERNVIEKKYTFLFEKAENDVERNSIAKEAWEEADKLTEKYLQSLAYTPYNFQKGSIRFRNYWEKKTQKLFEQN